MHRIFATLHYTLWLISRPVLYVVDSVRWAIGAAAFLCLALLAGCVMRVMRWGPVRWLLHLPAACGDRLLFWLHTRDWRYLLQGAPALLVAGAIGFVLLAQAIKPKIKDIERYQAVAEAALARQDWKAADVWLRKLEQLGVDNAETRFRMAIVAQQLGRQQRAERLIRELAPDDAVGYPAAHFLVAQAIEKSRVDEESRVQSLESRAREESRVDEKSRVQSLGSRAREEDERKANLGGDSPLPGPPHRGEGEDEESRAGEESRVESLESRVGEESRVDEKSRVESLESRAGGQADPGGDSPLPGPPHRGEGEDEESRVQSLESRAGEEVEVAAPQASSLESQASEESRVESLESRAGENPTQASSLRSQASEELLVHHLKAAVGSRFAAVAHAWLAQIYSSRGDYRQALDHLQRAVDANPELGFDVARLHRVLEQPAAAQRQLERTERYYRQRVEKDAEDVPSRLRLANALTLQGKHAEAERLLKAGFAATRDPRLGSALAAIYVAVAERLEHDAQQPIGLHLQLLEQALLYSPSHPQALAALLSLLDHDAPQPPVDQATLEQALAGGQARSTAHLLLAARALEQGSLRPAHMHLEQAYRLHPRMQEVVNSLARALADANPPQPDRALQLADAALRVRPGDDSVRSTRGEIMAEMR